MDESSNINCSVNLCLFDVDDIEEDEDVAVLLLLLDTINSVPLFDLVIVLLFICISCCCCCFK
jgi:hypothetical protein